MKRAVVSVVILATVLACLVTGTAAHDRRLNADTISVTSRLEGEDGKEHVVKVREGFRSQVTKLIPLKPPMRQAEEQAELKACACEDVAPNADFTCEEQREFGKCNVDWMVNGDWCKCTCNRC